MTQVSPGFMVNAIIMALIHYHRKRNDEFPGYNSRVEKFLDSRDKQLQCLENLY